MNSETKGSAAKKENPGKKYVKVFTGMSFLLKYYAMSGKPVIAYNLIGAVVFQPVRTAFYATQRSSSAKIPSGSSSVSLMISLSFPFGFTSSSHLHFNSSYSKLQSDKKNGE